LAVDSNGNLFAAEDYYIASYTFGGIRSVLAGTGSSGFADGIGGSASFARPAGMAFLSNGTMVLADEANHIVRKITTSGSALFC
jgi:hypothetical protein